MSKSFFTMLALAASVALTGFAAAPASALPVTKSMAAQQSNDIVQVRHGGGRHGGGLGLRSGGVRHGGFGIHSGGVRHFNRGHGFRHHYRPRIWIAPVYGYRSYGHSCYYLKRKAIHTGSRYWWRRYNQCRWG